VVSIPKFNLDFEASQPGSVDIDAGFDDENSQLVIFTSKIKSKRQLETLVVHELVHAYDHCRAHVNWSDLKHAACSEIRAYQIASQCAFEKRFEDWSGLSILFENSVNNDNYEKCLKLEALKSVLALKDVKEKDAIKTIDEVYPKCAYDYAPFSQKEVFGWKIEDS